jgi:small GTP-binding protein|eukprot:gnl/Ergobibamus_cyprinoides/2093.p1 GENE.gnl/Ergobibamus_cyprinoides/2093~~gnl/Ergobibamus_cyprinoides/2093.p1  ORF type:complete len:196 (+),score=92.90 gnl/Ergobibamus_cyprinoides/2093:22-588(+)
MADQLKVVVVGSGGVGKSCLTVRFVKDKFLTRYDPTIEDFYRKQVEVGGEAVMLDILDTAGQDEFSTLRDQYMRTGHGFILVYSVTSSTSFDDCRALHAQILRVKEKEGDVPIVLVGNKCDLEEERAVSKEEGEALAAELGKSVFFMETSAKENINVSELFIELVTRVKADMAANPPPAPAKKLCSML